MLEQPHPGPFTRVFPAELDYAELDAVYYPRARRRLVDATARRQFTATVAKIAALSPTPRCSTRSARTRPTPGRGANGQFDPR
ncbi:hypothetical protein Q5425_26825 [Amycolatopsis sp. A133]|uniref:hypothetical protein n=1 Tax=Amycolatopsis sp. A133 TaxID=3064472 RepID=UPI0027E8A631|nr:hypothetical protein [Amycolatopsis sp. A133]MDQ7807367.1 hypothetical protein [Amycolatopsis sp. A133]